ncbi:hypothetical protein PVAP13_5NG643400 [Panicum virgatum]|uniref:Uncharacterized protein n=1 Tax=Panicum virgatum TaxID=38727 RepID=A0A8T0S734_PANVG|nr:hypothetical protein PVAP13_5NG643400 [Panicum virgatum]
MKMLKRRRSLKRNESVDDLTRSSKKNKRTYLTRTSTKNKIIRNEGETTELLISALSEHSLQRCIIELSEQVVSKLSKSVVSLSLSNGRMVLFTCSGIAVQRERNITRFVTSASLVKALFKEKKYHDNLKVKVCHKDSVVIGFLGEYDLDCNFAVVNAKNFLDLETVGFRYLLEFPPDDRYLSLPSTSGILKCDLSRSVPSLVRTTCKISKVCEGGAVFYYDGNFLGMNLVFSTEGTLFMPEYRLHEKLFHFWLKKVPMMALFLLMKMALFWLMKMPLFWLIILKNLLATYVVEVSGMN